MTIRVVSVSDKIKNTNRMNRRYNSPASHRLFPQCVALLIPILIPVARIYAQTQAGMNASARAEFVQADAELNKTYQSVLAKLPTVESKQKLREEQRAWVGSRDAEAARAPKETDGGSMAPTLRYETMTRLTRDRIKELNNRVDHGTQNGANPAESDATTSPSSTPESTSEQAQSIFETGRTASSSASSVSPDKQWEYKCAEYGLDQYAPEIVKAGTREIVLDLNQELGVSGPDAKETEVIWRPIRNGSSAITVRCMRTIRYFNRSPFINCVATNGQRCIHRWTKHQSASSWRNLARAICPKTLTPAVARPSATF